MKIFKDMVSVMEDSRRPFHSQNNPVAHPGGDSSLYKITVKGVISNLKSKIRIMSSHGYVSS